MACVTLETLPGLATLPFGHRVSQEYNCTPCILVSETPWYFIVRFFMGLFVCILKCSRIQKRFSFSLTPGIKKSTLAVVISIRPLYSHTHTHTHTLVSHKIKGPDRNSTILDVKSLQILFRPRRYHLPLYYYYLPIRQNEELYY